MLSLIQGYRYDELTALGTVERNVAVQTSSVLLPKNLSVARLMEIWPRGLQFRVEVATSDLVPAHHAVLGAYCQLPNDAGPEGGRDGQ